MLLTHKLLNEIAMCDDRRMMMMAMGAPLLDWRSKTMALSAVEWALDGREIRSEHRKKNVKLFSASFFPCRYIRWNYQFFCCLSSALIIDTAANGIRIPEENWSYLISSNSHLTTNFFFRCNSTAKVSLRLSISFRFSPGLIYQLLSQKRQ